MFLTFAFLFGLTSTSSPDVISAKRFAPSTSTQEVIDADQLKKLKQEKVKVAKDAYSHYFKDRHEAEPLNQLSVRVLRSELDVAVNRLEEIAAYQGHFNRMRASFEFIDRQRKEQNLSKQEWFASRYFLLEAQIWLETARLKHK